MEITKRNLVLTFGTALATELDVVIKNPLDPVTEQAIKDAMDAIVTSNALGEVTQASTIIGARYVIQQESEVELPL